jgi:protein phosphatase
MKIELFQPLYIHEIGTRDNQEDALWPKNPTIDDRLFVLCDGMGGHEHGEVASQTVTQALGKWFAEHVDVAAPINDDQIRDAIEYAYTQLDKYADGSPRQMGTTLTLIYFGNSGVTAAHMGDSRIYHIRPSEGLLYVSRDHSLVFDLYQSGEITYDEMKNFKQKNIVTRAMTPGEDNRMRADIIHITDIQPGDYFYLCSDGMLEQMSNDELVGILSSKDSDAEKQSLLIKATSDNQDNHTAWIIQVKDVIKEEGDEALENEEPTARCNAINIIPVDNGEADVQIIKEEDDVVMVSEPPTPKKKQIPFLEWIKWIFAAILCLVVLVAACFVLLGNDEKGEKQTSMPAVMQNPITRKATDTIKTNTTDTLNHDSAGNQ